MNISPSAISRLIHWFEENGRHSLPWRQAPTPYRVWVSEIMLQQTQVRTVLDYFSRFLSAFPDIQALANAEEETVLRQWEGLGYYRRARQMHAAAKIITNEKNGHFPDTFSEILALPGIGRYTAGAILSFAFNKPFPILEANTQRLFARLNALQIPVSSSQAQKLLWKTAEEFIIPNTSSESPRILNTALMDLGSIVCTPQEPQCEKCPFLDECEAKRGNLTARIPYSPPKIKYEDRMEAAALITRTFTHSENMDNEFSSEREFLLVRCVEGEWWAGLWDFPRVKIQNEETIQLELQRFIQQTIGLKTTITEKFADFRHSVTKYRIRLRAFHTSFTDNEQKKQTISRQTPSGGEIRWVRESDLETFPLCSSGRKIAQKILHS